MKIDDIKFKSEQLRRLVWLERISFDYNKILERIDRENDFFRVISVSFLCRSDGEVFHFNPSYPLPFNYVRDGIADVLNRINLDIELLKAEIEK